MTNAVFQTEPCTPSKIVCIGRNYVAHIDELGNEIPEQMVVFNKPPSSLSDTLQSFQREPLHYECELCFIVRDQQLAGVGIGLDLTKRDTQSRLKARGLPWERAKAFDGAATFSAFVPVPDDLTALSFTLHIDGELTQQGNPDLMMYPPQTILTELSRFMTLSDHDIIMTGTPKGVGIVERDRHYTGRLYLGNTCLIEHTWIAQ